MPRQDGSPTIAEMLATCPKFEEEPNPRPPEEDCPGCPGHKDGPHKMSCRVQKTRIVLSVKEEPNPDGQETSLSLSFDVRKNRA